jgi:hypothetical protein
MMDYSAIFERRGHAYHLAMQLAPEARRLEFEALFSAQPLNPGEVLFDIPSGGGYLDDYISVPVQVEGFEFSKGFADENPAVSLLHPEQEWPIGLADRVVSLAGLHHNADPLAVIARLKSHVRPGGWLHVADVAEGSRVGAFLNGFVDAANPMGHDGIFLPSGRSRYPQAWNITRLEVCPCPWHFSSVAEMARFCKLMFGLNPDCDDGLVRALQETVGFVQTEKGPVLNWELLYMDVFCE